MPQRDLEIGTLLLDVVNACRTIEEIVATRTFDDYTSDIIVRSAVERQFTIVGEALRAALPREPALAETIPDIRRIIDFRNILVHGYRKLDDAIVWKTVREDLPRLAATVRGLLAS
jgi:uncharacterized protein with HEPN domain